MQILKYQIIYNVVLVIEDLDKKIDINKLNYKFNEYLISTGEIKPTELYTLKRINRFQEVVEAGCLGTLDINKLKILFEEEIKTKFGNTKLIPDDLLNKYSYIKIPERNPVTGEVRRGAFVHTLSIDVGVEPLVKALNSLSKVKTFSSCDGHFIKPMYVMFKVEDNKKVAHVLKKIDDAFNKIYPKYNFEFGPFKVKYECGHIIDNEDPDWQVFYRIIIHYNTKIIDAKTFYEYIKEVGEEICES